VRRVNHLSRRSFLVSAGAATTLAACGGSSSSKSTDTKDVTDITASKGAYELAASFAPDSITAGIPERLTFSLVNASDGSGVQKGPDQITGQLSFNGANVGAPVSMKRRAKDLIRPYWAISTTFDRPGNWAFTATFPDGTTAAKAFTVLAKSFNKMPNIGDKLLSVDTATTKDKHGVDPICTRQPQCPLHDISLKDAIAAHKPIAFIIGTPAYCQTGICGPVLELVIAQQKNFPNIQMIHSEVYSMPYYGTGTPLAPAVDTYNLSFEPYLVVADASGVIRSRLDVIFDAEELTAALKTVA
jgi:hypothetical protein